MISLSKASRFDLNKLDVPCRRGLAAKAAIRLLTAMSMSAVLGVGCQEPSWNENTKVFSGLAINSENISQRYSHY